MAGKGFDRIAEHYLVPTALVVLNMAAVHALFAHAYQPHEPAPLALLAVAIALLAAALATKRRYLLVLSVAYYLAVLAAAFLG